MNIGIKNTQRKQKLPTAALARKLGKLLRDVGLPDSELGVLFVGDRAMRSLNRRFRGKDRTTDVLSFPLHDPKFRHIRPVPLGDIVISVPVALRQAAEAGHSLKQELGILLIHGLVHLLGYDHEAGEQEARRMRRKEIRLLKKFSL